MDDLISRQATLDALEWKWAGPAAIKAIEELPSAEPLVRCGECKHRDPEDHKCDCGHDIIWQLPRDDNWYCADGKRRTDVEKAD